MSIRCLKLPAVNCHGCLCSGGGVCNRLSAPSQEEIDLPVMMPGPHRCLHSPRHQCADANSGLSAPSGTSQSCKELNFLFIFPVSPAVKKGRGGFGDDDDDDDDDDLEDLSDMGEDEEDEDSGW